MKSNQNKLSYIEGWLSIFVNLFLFILKYWAGIVTGSIAIIADAWHTLSDSISSIIVLIGAKVSSKPADQQHPFGHGRAELISSMIIGVFLAIVAFSFMEESIKKLQQHESVTFGAFAIIVICTSILAKEALAQFAFWTFRKTDAYSLKADGWHHRSDAISSIIILIGIIFGAKFWWMDGILGIAVALLLFYATYEIFTDSINPLLGKVPDSKTIEAVHQITKECGCIEFSAHHFHIHDYGNHIELTFHLYLPGETSLENAHETANKIEMALKDKLNIEATIHMEPLDSSNNYSKEEKLNEQIK